MPELFGKSWTRTELLKHAGDIRQIANVRLCELSDGPGRGVRVAEFNTGSGFAFTVLLDRGLDIYAASFKGMPLAWQSATGVVHPAYYEPAGTGLLRSFGGGWMNTCGLTNAGIPGRDIFGEYEFHGRASHLPAQLTGYGGRWHDDEYELWLEASIREVSLFGFDLQLTRRLTTRLGESHLQIVDVVENRGDREAPFMLLYHCNFGFPLVAEGARLVLNQKSVRARDEVAQAGIARHRVMEAPQAGYAEQVFFHEVNPEANGFATAAVVNDELKLAGYVSYRHKELPNLVQWKQMGAGAYVLGVEPANCAVLGRQAERERGTLQMLAPGESREMILRLGAIAGEKEIAEFSKRIKE
jgi:galactose mutarotase-like enzyme